MLWCQNSIQLLKWMAPPLSTWSEKWGFRLHMINESSSFKASLLKILTSKFLPEHCSWKWTISLYVLLDKRLSSAMTLYTNTALPILRPQPCCLPSICTSPTKTIWPGYCRIKLPDDLEPNTEYLIEPHKKKQKKNYLMTTHLKGLFSVMLKITLPPR